MNDQTGRNPGAAVSSGRRRNQLIVRAVVFAGVIAFFMLRPQLQEWFGDPDPDNDQQVASDKQNADANSRGATSDATSVNESGASGQTAGSGADDEVPLGELTQIRRDVFESTAGLVYSQYRIDHVLEHAEDDLSKPVHGVFAGDRETILAMIDEAFLKVRQGGPGVDSDQQGSRLVHVIDMKRVVGHVGGQKGERQNKPSCRKLQLVLETNNEVVTAYPTVN